MQLAGKVAVVTGGTRGLGRAIAETFLAEGATVVCAARTPGDLATGSEQPWADRLHYQPTDVTDEDSVQNLVADTVRRHGRVDVMVANAGVSRDGRVARLSLADWTTTVQTNLTGVFLCARAVVQPMRAQGGGRIITVSSSLATRPVEGAAAYCATKAAVESFTRTAAVELGPHGIAVNCLAPGYFDGGMGRRLAADPDLWKRYQSRLVLDRLGYPDELAAAAVFLASSASSYVNGHVLEVSGGLRWAA